MYRREVSTAISVQTKGSEEDKRGLASPDVLENDRSLDLGLTSARFHTLPTHDPTEEGTP